MGVIRPGGWKTVGPKTISPEEHRRLNSGVWSRKYNMETCVESWTLDKAKLHKLLAEAFNDPETAERFRLNTKAHLDRVFGEGTYDAYMYHKRPTVTDEHREDSNDMGTYWSDNNTSTASGTFTTTGSSSVTSNTFIVDTLARNRGMEEGRRIAKKVSKASHSHPTRNVKLNVPFLRRNNLTLLEQLQEDFDRWAGDCMPATL